MKPAGTRTTRSPSSTCQPLTRRAMLHGGATACALQASASLRSAAAAPPAEYVRFGQTDLMVTRYCQGTAFRKVPRSDNTAARRILFRCLDVGINFFDSAEAYGWGGSETVLGKVIRGRREKLVICTKAAPSLAPVKDPDTNKFRLGKKITFTRQNLTEKLNGSLKRLGTDYVDLFLLHSPDEAQTPPAQLAQWMESLVKSGKTRYWGISNYPATQVAEFHQLGIKGQSTSPIAGTEDYFNIASRDRFEPEMPPVMRRTKLGLLAFSPQDMGRLAPERTIDAIEQPLVRVLDEVARELGATRPQVTIAWVLSRSEVTSALGGAETPEQAAENFAGSRLQLPADLKKRLDAASEALLAAKRKRKKKAAS